MKKLICLLVAMTLCLSCVALAVAAPSKTTANMTQATVQSVVLGNRNTAQTMNTAGFMFRIVTEKTDENGMPVEGETTEENEKVEKILAIAKAEIEKLAASESVEAYFGEILDAEGNVIDLMELLGIEVVEGVAGVEGVEGIEELFVHEFHPILVAGFEEVSGDVTLKLLFPTPYEVGEKVVVMIGVATENEDGSHTVAWKAFAGVGVEVPENEIEALGAIEVTVDAKTALVVQDGTALLAVVSK